MSSKDVTDREEKLRLAGSIAGRARDYGSGLIKEDATYLDVAEAVEQFIVDNGGQPAFPVNIAVNDVAAHYTPRKNDPITFEHGDIVKLDVGCHIDGFIGDTAVTVEIGTNTWSSLIKSVSDALESAIDFVKPGVSMCDIGGVIERVINSHGFTSVSNLTGHGMERYNLHAGKTVPNVYDRSFKDFAQAGDVLAIEPFATDGPGRVKGKKNSNIYRVLACREMRAPDAHTLLQEASVRFNGLPFAERWCHGIVGSLEPSLKRLVRVGCVTMYPILFEKGGGMVSQKEHTVLVTEDGCKVMTQP